MNKPTIYFDMDGTIADFYGVPDWRKAIDSYDVRPYKQAKGLVNLSQLARLLNKLQAQGYKVGVISWCSRTGTEEFNGEVEYTKRKWLAQHLSSVHFDDIRILPYGTPKHAYAKPNDILFDDEYNNRKKWRQMGGCAFAEGYIFHILNKLLKEKGC